MRQWRWSELHEVRSEMVEFERVRIALWDEPKRRISYNRMLFTWFCDRPGGPVIDVVLRGDQDRARLIREEIILRMSERPEDRGAISDACMRAGRSPGCHRCCR